MRWQVTTYTDSHFHQILACRSMRGNEELAQRGNEEGSNLKGCISIEKSNNWPKDSLHGEGKQDEGLTNNGQLVVQSGSIQGRETRTRINQDGDLANG